MTNSSQPVDLRPFLRAIGGAPTRGALDVPERPEPEQPAELLDSDSVKVAADPFDSPLFIDGIQSCSVVTYRSHRPLALVAAAAGALSPDLQPKHLQESLELLCSDMDIDWVVDKGCPVAVRPVTSSENPVVVERAIAADLAARRDELEILVAAEALQSEPDDQVIAVDGHLARRPYDPRLIGVVKTTSSRLLQDESVLWRLGVGWRSPRFVMPENFGGPSAQRYSCYVRLRDASRAPWGFGLIRVETYDPELLDRAAATALAYRQATGTHDARGDRHLAPVAFVEKWLRSRRPSYL